MFSYEQRVAHVIEAPSSDVAAGEAIFHFLTLLDRLRVEHVVFGSAAMQAYLPYCQRLPGDLDILLDESEIPRIRQAVASDKLTEFVHHDVASKVLFRDKFWLHLVPKEMRIVDKHDGVVFTRVNLYFPDRIVQRHLQLVGVAKRISLQVPTLEYLFCMHLNRTLDSNTFSSYVAILERWDLNPLLINEFVVRVPLIGEVLKFRFEALREALSLHRPDLMNRLPPI